MSHVKDYVARALDIQYFLTYADNFAIGYFKKQVSEITLIVYLNTNVHRALQLKFP